MKLLKNTALLVIDVQQGFDDPYWGKRNNLDAEKNIQQLIQQWRANEAPIIFIQHASTSVDSPLNPKKPGFAFKKEAMPLSDEIVIVKQVNSAFIGTNLEAYLKQNNIKDIVVVGLTTDHCVSTTTRMGANLGFNMILVADATATFDKYDHQGQHYPAKIVHEVQLASLHQEFAEVVETKQLLNLK